MWAKLSWWQADGKIFAGELVDEHLITTTANLNAQTQISIITFQTHDDIKGPAHAMDRIVNNAAFCAHLDSSFRPLTLREKLVVDAGKYFN